MSINPNLDHANINAHTKFGKIQSICSQDIDGNKNLTWIKGHNSIINLGKMTGNNINLDLVNINAHTKFGQILSISSLDIERKWKSSTLAYAIQPVQLHDFNNSDSESAWKTV